MENADSEFHPRIFEREVDPDELDPDELLRRAEVFRDRYKEALDDASDWREPWYECVTALSRQGLGHKRIAAILGEPRSTIRQILARKKA